MNECSRPPPRRPLKRARCCGDLSLLEGQPPWSPPPPPEVDLISALPDDVLLSIISRLPLEQWISLSAVSRLWRRLSSLLPHHECICFDVSTPHLPPPPGPIPHAVLRRCHIVYSCFVRPDAQLELLLRAKDVCVQELILHNCWQASPVLIPDLVLSIKSLTVLLLLSCHLTYRVPRPRSRSIFSLVGIGCKHLRTLRVEKSFIHEHILILILANCLALETLLLVDTYGFKDAKIHSTSLKRLWLKPRKSIESIVVDAPELEVLVLQTRLKLHALDLRAPKTQKVCFDFANPLRSPQVRMKGFLLAANNLTWMSLSAAAVEILTVECEELEKLNVSFEKLKSLTICLDIKQEPQAQLLVKLLESCPSLSWLSLEVIQTRVKSNIATFSKHIDRLKKLDCLSHHLEAVNMHLLLKVPYELELTRFFMTETKGLKKMIVLLPISRIKKDIKDIFPLDDAFFVHTNDSYGTKTIEIIF